MQTQQSFVAPFRIHVQLMFIQLSVQMEVRDHAGRIFAKLVEISLQLQYVAPFVIHRICAKVEQLVTHQQVSALVANQFFYCWRTI